MKLHLTGWLLLIMLCGIVSDPVSAQTTPLRGPKNATDQFSGAVYGPIDSQDTLWRIANRYRQNQNLTIYQVMVAIYELNPDAFEQQNLNLMVDGATLKLPSDRYIARIDPTKARLKAEAENRSKDRFLAHLSHELRTPLSSILGYTELLMQSDKNQHAQNELGVIYRNGKHLLSLLNDVLDLSKIAADKLELNCSDVNLDSLMADVYTLMRVSALDKGLTLKFESQQDLPLVINTDATRLRQILINIINKLI